MCVLCLLKERVKGREEEHTEIYSGSPNVG